MPACIARRPGTGLSALARRDYLARVKRETTLRFTIIRGLAKGYAGLIPTSLLDSIKADKVFAKTDFLPYVISVLRLHGYEVESTDAGLRYGVQRMAA
jgi:hypothetical protein